MSDAADEVLAANEAFYSAFDRRDAAGMEALWAREHPIACIHPGWAPLFGRRSVLESWQRILTGPAPPRVACTDARVHLYGECAFVVCTERLEDGNLVATNVFARENGAWKLVHHQAGPLPPQAESPAGDTVH